MLLKELRNLLKKMGIVGAGGAGFPTYGKLSDGVKKIILNGAECEPLFKVDRNILKNKAYEVLKGLEFLLETLEAEEGIIAIKENYKEANEAIDFFIDNFKNLKKVTLKDGYPIGDEVVLIYESTGLLVPQGGIPLEVGVIVINVETALNIYNGVFQNRPVIEKYITIGGEVKNPLILKVPIGISFNDLIKEAGGATIKDFKLLVGGPMTGRLGNINETVTKTVKGIFLLPKDNKAIELREKELSIDIKRTMSICSQCRVCTDLCPRNLLGHSIEPHRIMNSLAFKDENNINVFVNALACSECNLCSVYACHQSLDPKRIISSLKAKLRENGVKLNKNKNLKVNESREYKRVPVSRVLNRLDLINYDKNLDIIEKNIDFKILKIALNQSLGQKPKAKVKPLEKVKKYQVIAASHEKELGVDLHSPIDGTVLEINEKSIVIKKGDVELE
ncbi:4Fe-4S dicluster domain-containing protein [Clostridium fallax]|uniref:Na+-translocating ferredoxin:NAD+ oxidoreductase RNF, RnfC subunit n=1 Tax=Clostridium fallax TaxID=1533 RepID=A0A1M4XB07_9CLOT|nr:4Fe-4S dicluster domain-containing protein [Clostridium fallax]SHE90728.1 Na+-translocating ferredoxin:NAD+ oxidoreductase RNF, RnfC subunit [Clostridium fallax]SQB05997.1 respiratory-chain NADH dehydrogenase domain-containing protein [Clostridium fallax]